MKTWTTFWFEINDENSDLCGEEFFVELDDSLGRPTKQSAIDYAQSIFPNEKLHFLGKVSALEAEMMGLDTY